MSTTPTVYASESDAAPPEVDNLALSIGGNGVGPFDMNGLEIITAFLGEICIPLGRQYYLVLRQKGFSDARSDTGSRTATLVKDDRCRMQSTEPQPALPLAATLVPPCNDENAPPGTCPASAYAPTADFIANEHPNGLCHLVLTYHRRTRSSPQARVVIKYGASTYDVLVPPPLKKDLARATMGIRNRPRRRMAVGQSYHIDEGRLRRRLDANEAYQLRRQLACD